MIKPNELRIGNLVTWSGEEVEHILTVLGIYQNDSVCIEYPCLVYDVPTTDFTDMSLSSIKPIPLTEEWLLRFGFEMDAHSWHSKEFMIHGQMIPTEVYCMSINAESNRCAIRMVGYVDSPFKKTQPSNYSEIQYVHQLQNFYFALVGEELKLTA